MEGTENRHPTAHRARGSFSSVKIRAAMLLAHCAIGYAPVVIRRTIPWVFASLVAACNAAPIEWQDSVVPAAALESAPALAFDSTGHLVAVRARATDLPAAGRCTVVGTARSVSGIIYATWWSLRSDNSADLMAAVSVDGRVWSKPVRVDSADAGRSGCDRPPPAIAADGDNVHIVYAMQAREGPGIFLAHSMDRGALFHSPVAVVYGEKPGLASVVARGNFVVVAYEDPNTSPTRVSVAISTTMAHLFEYRHVVSPPGGAVAAPNVATDGTRVVVSWVRAPAELLSARVARVGIVR